MKKIRQIEVFICDICQREMKPYDFGKTKIQSIKFSVPSDDDIDAQDICANCNRIILNSITLCKQKATDNDK